MSHRSSSSILKNVDHEELIAYSLQDYVQKALDLANDRERIGEYKKTLRKAYLSSSICDTDGFARDLEQAYRVMWQKKVEEINAISEK